MSKMILTVSFLALYLLAPVALADSLIKANITTIVDNKTNDNLVFTYSKQKPRKKDICKNKKVSAKNSAQCQDDSFSIFPKTEITAFFNVIVSKPGKALVCQVTQYAMLSDIDKRLVSCGENNVFPINKKYTCKMEGDAVNFSKNKNTANVQCKLIVTKK